MNKKILVLLLTFIGIAFIVAVIALLGKEKKDTNQKNIEVLQMEKESNPEATKGIADEADYTEEDWLKDRERMAKEIEEEQRAVDEYKKVDENGNTTYYEGLVPSDYDGMSWDMMLSSLLEAEVIIFGDDTKEKLTDDLHGYLGFVAWQFCNNHAIEDMYKFDPAEDIIENINNDIVTYKLHGYQSELDIMIDFYNEHVHLKNYELY